MPFVPDKNPKPSGRFVPDEEVDNRTTGDVATDLVKGLGGAAVSAVGAVPTALGRVVQEGGEKLLGMTMDEARRLAEAEGKPERALEWYEKSNRLNPASIAGRGIEAAGQWISKKGDEIRDSRSPQAKEKARQSTPDGDITQPDTWTMGSNPSVEGVAQVLADVTGSMAPNVAAAVATRGRSATTQMNVGGATVAAQTGGGAMDEATQYLNQFDDAKLRTVSPTFRELEAKGYSPADAREILLRDAQNRAGAYAAPVGFAGGKATSALLGKPGEHLAGKMGSTVAKVAVLGALGATEEGLQEVGEGIATRAGINDATGMNRSLTEGTFGEFILGAKAGGTTAGGKAVLDRALQGIQGTDGQNQDQRGPAPVAESQAPAPEAGDGGRAPTRAGAAPDLQYPDPVSRGTEPSEAERALREPVGLTALDRAGEISQEQARLQERLAELNDPAGGYGQMFDQERQQLTERAQALAAERDQITRDWPKAEPGAATSFTTEAGVRLDGQYALMDIDSLVTSHDANLRQNPAYPQELQPRARDRAASEMQISGIVGKLDPARLGLSADAATGAPIVGADGLVESGNARTIALKRIYQANGQKAADYRQFLTDNAAQFGLSPEQIQGMGKPVLVRVRSTPVNRAEFARQANASTVAAMSPSEQAKSDAARIDSMDDLQPDEQGDFRTSRDFIRRFMARLPVTEQAGMVDAGGALSATGYARVRNAVLAKAYGDSAVLMRMVESMDDNLRNVSKALMTAAPKVAQMREAVAAGQRFDADITPDLMAAVEELSRLKDDGVSVQDALAQAGMFGEKYSPETRDLLQFLADNIRRPRRMADFIVAYMEALDAAGDPNQGSLLGDTTAPAKADLLAAAGRTVQGEPDAQGSNVAREDGQDPGPGAEGDGQRQDAQGGEGRAQGDGSAAPASTKRDPRAEAVADFKDALADLAEIASRHTRATMMQPNHPGLHKTLVKLFTAAFRIVGTDMRAATRWVREQLRNDPENKKIANFIKNESMERAAREALEKVEKEGGSQGGLFDSPAQATQAVQSDLFAEPAKPATNPKNIYRAYPLTPEDRAALLKRFPPRFERVIADHISAEGLRSMDKVLEGGADGKVVGVANGEGYQALVVSVNGREKTSEGTYFHISWSVAPGVKTGTIGPSISRDGFERLGKPINIDLSAGPSVKKPLKESYLSEREPGEADKAFAKRVVDKRAAPTTLPENHADYFIMDGAKVVDIADLVSTKSAEENAQGGENGAKRMEAAARGELSKRAPITVMPSEKQPGKYEVVDGNGTLTSVSKYGWKRMPVQVVTRAEGLAMIEADKLKDRLKGNYKAPSLASVVGDKVAESVERLVAIWKPKLPKAKVAAADLAKAVKLLEPVIEAAKKDEAAFDKAVKKVASGFMGYALGPTKKIDRAAVKLVEEGFDVSEMKDIVRATIVVASYDQAQQVIDALAKEFKIRQINNKSATEITPIEGVKLKNKGVSPEGYQDVTAFVYLPGGGTAEVQINTPEMLAAKDAGHTLYEGSRAVVNDPERQDIYEELRDAQVALYSAADFANRKNSASVQEWANEPAGSAGRGMSMPVSSLNRNTLPSGNSTQVDDERSSWNRVPAGNLSGTGIDITSPLNNSVPQLPANGYTGGDLFGADDANVQPGAGSTQAQGAGPAQENGRGGNAAGVRARPGRGDRQPGGDADAGAAAARGVGQAGSDGVRGADARGGSDESGGRAGRPAGVPAGRDIPAKTGRNYRFGPDDLTYSGSWLKKAEQNVEAVELLRTLEKEGRQATPEEQAKLAQFVGWGSSDLANNLFGKKLDSVADAIKDYDEAIQSMDALKRDYLQKGGQFRGSYADSGYYQATNVLRAAKKIGVHDYPQRVTREDLEKAKPDGTAKKWLALRDRLRAAMTADELAEASRSTQYAHYTSKSVVSSMWKAMERMGFKGGTILEPGAGIGVFPGLMPESMAANSIYTGVEFDSITGGVLKQLFPDERILVESFVDSKLPKNFYDVAIGNPPFSGTKILGDPEYAKRALSLHDYFFAKSIDRVKPGGLVVYVTSRYTMDKIDDKARAYLAERADLVGAIRLPQTAFKQNAGTEVVTDVIFLRKKVPGETFAGAQAWAKSGEIKGADGKTLMVKDKHGKEKPAMVNEYFAAHPEMVLGQHANTGSIYSDQEYTVMPLEGDIEAHFAKAVENLPADIYQAKRGSAAEAAKVREIDFNPKAKKEGNYYVSDKGVLMIREGGVGQTVDLKSPKDVELIKDFVPLRDALKQAHYDQLNDGQWETSLKALQDAYAKFTKKHGQINQFTTRIVKSKVTDEETGETYTDETPVRSYQLLEKLRDDPDYTLVAALETVNDDTGAIKPSNFLTDRVLGKVQAAAVATPADALLSSLNDVGEVDIGLIAGRLGLSEQETIDALGSAIYEDPEAGWQTADDYLSGNVKRKLEAAREAAKADRRYERNVQALEAAQPEPKTPSQIDVTMGMNWIPGADYQQFMRETTGVDAKVIWNDQARQWALEYETPATHKVVNRWGREHGVYKSQSAAEKAAEKLNAGRSEPMFSVAQIDNAEVKRQAEEWGTLDITAGEIMDHALNARQIRLTKSEGTGKDKKSVFDPVATEAANQKLEKLQQAFASWVWSDPDRADRLVRLYNDKFNTNVPRSFDGRHLTLPGASAHWQRIVHPHVKRGVWRIVQKGNTYLSHAVGSGKTAQIVMAAMEQKRLGLIKKPMIVVPNHMLKQFASEWMDIYPAARLMVADENNFHTENRRRFVSRVALSDLDGVVITHSAFKLLDLDPVFKAKIIEEQLDVMRAALESAEQEDGKGGRKSPRIKQIEKQIENLEQKLKASLSSQGKDRNVRFDELGVDFLMVDEAHEFRKLDFGTNRQIKGISPEGSARALDLYIKVRYLETKNPGRSLVMASGTPVTNTLAELYTVQRFMGAQALEEKGIDDFDSWASMFGRERTELEPDAAGRYVPVTRFSKFVNVPELTQMFRDFADVLTSDHLAALLGDKRPKVENGGRKIITTPKTRDYKLYQRELERRVAQSKAWRPSKEEPNNPDPIIKIIGDGRLAAIDMRFAYPDAPSDPDSKLNKMIDDVIATFKATSDMEFTDKAGKVEPNKGASMMVFSDLGFGAGVAASRGFNARAWFEKRLRDAGVPPAQVAFMSDYKKSSDKLKLFKDVNAGRVRILVGSSKNMGTGVNAQRRLKALFHLDSPWYPADLEQREGRIVRQGNENKFVQIFAYAAKGTYDENMWKMLASKQYFIDQALSGDQNIRELEDLSNQSQFDQAAAMVAEDPRVMQLAGAKAEIEKLNRLYKAHEDHRFRYRDQYDQAKITLQFNEKRLPAAEKAAAMAQDLSGDKFTAKALGKTYTDRKEWANALMEKFKDLSAAVESKPLTLGEISGFKVEYKPETVGTEFRPKAMLMTADPMILFSDPSDPLTGIAMRAQNAVAEVARLPAKMRERMVEARAQIDALQTKLEAPFPMAGMLADKVKEAADLAAAIEADSKRPDRPANGEEFGQLYHGTAVAFDAFSLDRAGKGNRYDHQGKAAYLTSDRDGYARFFAAQVGGLQEPMTDGVILSVKLDPKARILDLRAKDADAEVLALFKDSAGNRAQGEALREKVLELGYDGIAFTEPNFPEGWKVDTEATTVALYNPELAKVEPQQGEAPTQLARGAGTGGMAMRDLQAVVARVSKGLKNLPKVHVFASPADLSAKVADQKALRDFIKKAGAMGDVEGATHNGEIYLFASGLADEARAEHVLATHELTHYGLRGAMGKDLDAALQHVWVNNARIRKQAAEARQRLGLASNLDAVEEVLAEIPASELVAVKGWRRVVKVARDWLNRIGATSMAQQLDKWLQAGMSDQARADLFVADLLTAAREWVRTGRGGRGAMLSDFTRLSSSLAEDAAKQEAWLTAEAKARGYKDIEDLLEKNYPVFEKLAAKWRELNPADGGVMLSRAPQRATPAERADKILATKAGSRAPLDYLARVATRITGIERLTGALYRRAGYLLDRYTPEQIKAGVVADYGVPEAVIDQRAMMQGRQRVQLRKAGALIEKLSTLTRAESRVAYEWMNMDGADPKAYLSMMQGLPEESVKVLQEVQQMIDKLSREAVALGQLSPEAYERNRMAYLRRSYAKHVLEQDAGEKAKRARVISILGDQYKGRGLTEAADMSKVKNIAPEWWKRKLQAGKGDASLKGEKFVRLERRAPAGAGTQALPGMTTRPEGKLLEVAYYPAGQALPAQFKDWEQRGTFEVRDVKGPNLILWRDFTKEERERMGEVDEARFAIAKTLHGMIHDVEVGRYLEWIGHTYAKKEGETIPGTVVEASERYRDTFAPGEWVRVPDAKIPGTQVAKYGKLAGRYIPGPVWNDLRQVVGGEFRPFGDTYAKILTLWKTAKTALSPAVHMNNVMSNFVMADWHDVGAAHVAKSLRLILAASQRQGVGVLGRAGNLAAGAGIADREAAREVLNRYKDSGGDIGSWVTNEISRDQLEPLLANLEKELAATAGASNQAQVGVFAALQHALMLRFPSAWDAFKESKPGKAAGTEAQSLIDLYQAEDDLFRLAAWLKAKEEGKGDLEAGRAARKSFLDYHINAPWIQAMRSTAWPFVSFTYRAVPMMLEIAGKKPHKLMKLMMIAGGLNVLGSMLAGGDDDDEERKMLPEEKAGKIWGMVPKLVRMPWNDQHGHPVYLDIRRFIPVGDVFDVGQGHSAVPILPGLQPGGPMALAAEVVVNRSMFTGKPITLDTDTPAQQAVKVGDYLYKAFAPNILGLPGTYATTAVGDAAQGKTDAFGRQQSVAQAVASSFGVKLGSYPADVLKLNLTRKAQAELMEIDRNITLLKRQRMTNQIDQAEFEKRAKIEQDKQRKVIEKVREKIE